MSKEVTMKDIADALGVSTVSVSKALTGKDGVSHEVRKMIWEKARELGYEYTATKSGKETKKFTVAVIVDEQFMSSTTTNFYFKMYQSIVIKLSERNYSAILEIVTQAIIDNKKIPASVLEKRVDGILTLGKLSKEYLELLESTQLPMVFLDFSDESMNVPSVITDNVHGAYMITDYLIKNNHRDIAYIGSIEATPSILDRYLGYLRAMIVHRIPFVPEYVIQDRDENGNFIDLALPENMPTAFVCNCDDVAKNLIEKLSDMGYRIPEDISVAGFDNAIIAEYTNPKLTTVAVDVDSMTETACDLLIKKIDGSNDIHGHKVISGELILRDSVAQRRQENE